MREDTRADEGREDTRTHGPRLQARGAPTTIAVLDPRSRRSAHAHAHACPTLTRMLAPRAHARATRARPTPLRSAHPCARPTRTRTSKAVVRPAVVAPAAAAPDSAAEGAAVAVSMAPAVWQRPWRRWRPLISQPAVRGTGARVSSGLSREGQHAAGSRGQTSRRQAGAGGNSPAIRRDSGALVMLDAGRGRCRRAHSARR